MKPIEFPETNGVYGKGQDGVEPLPAYTFDTGEVMSCWELSPDEIEKVCQTGCIWLILHTVNMPLPPVFITANKNDIIVDDDGLNPQDKESVEA